MGWAYRSASDLSGAWLEGCSFAFAMCDFKEEAVYLTPKVRDDLSTDMWDSDRKSE